MTEEKIECPKCKKLDAKFIIEQYGCCLWCDDKEKKRLAEIRTSQEAIKTGETSYENKIFCPYCGTINSEEDLNESTNTYCEECGEEFRLEVELSVSYSTNKIEENKNA